MYAKTTSTTNVIRLVTAAVAVALTLTLVAAALPNITAQAAPASTTFRSRLAESAGAEKFAAMSDPVAAAVSTHNLSATPIAPVAPAVTRTSTRKSTSTGSTATSGATSAPAAASGDELAEAQSILAGLIAAHPILAGTTVSIGDAKGYQAISYYKSGRIVISATHTASLSRILNHEVWHVIDWRDNGVIDWGENIPPK
jgi:hypothetical protein